MTDRLSCPFCGKTFKSLMSHILYRHGLRTAEVLQRFPTLKFVAADTRMKTSTHCLGKGRPKGTKASASYKQALSIRMTGTGNHFFGKTHSTATRAKMVANHQNFTGANNPFSKWVAESPDNREKASQARKKSWQRLKENEARYAAYCEKRSRLSTQQLLDGKNIGFGKGHLHGWFFNEKWGRPIFYRSSYEKRFLDCCAGSTEILQLAACPFRIPYNDFTGRRRHYLPDYLVNADTIVEIKPGSLLTYDVNPLKFKAAAQYCEERELRFLLLTEKELVDAQSCHRLLCG